EVESRGADRLANHELLAARAGANREQVREISGGDQYEQQHPGLKQQQRRSNRVNVIAMQRDDNGLESRVSDYFRLWVGFLELGVLHFELRSGVGDRRAGS